MQQVLFHIPILKETFPPDGLPVNGFGVMLVLTFFTVVWLLGRLAAAWKTNLPAKQVDVLVLVLFLSGLAGARITYMIQYGVPWQQFVRIWEGGIVLYGGIIAGILAFLAFYFRALRPAGVNMWRLADAAAPPLALGIALGRVGCLLNGCCYGHVADDGSPGIDFPLLTCPAREVVVGKSAYQTPTGFIARGTPGDVRSVVEAVEPGSAAERAGLKVGDRIVRVNGEANGGVLLVAGDKAARDRAKAIAAEFGATAAPDEIGNDDRIRMDLADPHKFEAMRVKVQGELLLAARVMALDRLTDMLDNWPRGRQGLEFEVLRDGQTVALDRFVPRTIGLHPTQVYETVSMILLTLLLICFFPYRRHDGQVFTLFVACYAVHRFLNEILRNDTSAVGFQMTLSQNISVLMLLFAAALEIGLRWRKAGRADS